MDDEEYRQVRYDVRHEVYDALNRHLRMLAEENGVAIQTHKYPCMTISMFVNKIKEKYAGN